MLRQLHRCHTPTASDGPDKDTSLEVTFKKKKVTSKATEYNFFVLGTYHKKKLQHAKGFPWIQIHID